MLEVWSIFWICCCVAICCASICTMLTYKSEHKSETFIDPIAERINEITNAELDISSEETAELIKKALDSK